MLARKEAPRGAEVRVNEPLGKARYSSVAVAPSGEAVIVWTAYGHLDGSGQGVFGRCFAPDGQPLSATFQVNQTALYHQRTPSAAIVGENEFVVTWADALGDDDLSGIIGRRFRDWGIPMSDEFPVNTETTGNQIEPVIAAGGPDNSFTVAWTSVDHGGGSVIRAQHFGPEGRPLGEEFVIGTTGETLSRWPRIAVAPDGSLLATWSRESSSGDDSDVYFQHFDALGAPLHDVVRINTTTDGYQRYSALAVDADGSSLIGWIDEGTDGMTPRVVLREVSQDGLPFGAEIAAIAWNTADRTSPAMSYSSGQNVTLIWTREEPDGNDRGVCGQIITRMTARVPGDTDQDGDVDLMDLNNVRINFGYAGDERPGDTSGDGVVNLDDLNLVRNYFGVGTTESRRHGDTQLAEMPAFPTELDARRGPLGRHCVAQPTTIAAADLLFAREAEALPSIVNARPVRRTSQPFTQR